MDKRFQVFVSSTFADLKDERRSVFETLMKMRCIPAGMEVFPAIDEKQFKFIQRVIDDCDYYVLIIGGRYGSLTAKAKGISYTEKEYNYAVDKGMQVLAFIHDSPNSIPVNKTDDNPALRRKLEKFRQRVAKGRLVEHWSNAAELPGMVATSLIQVMNLHPAVGWVRADKVANEDMLLELNEVRKQNATLQKQLEKQAPAVPHLAELDEKFAIHLNLSGTRGKHRETIQTTWNDLFANLAPKILYRYSDAALRVGMGKALRSSLPGTFDGSAELDRNDYDTILIQFKALRLIERAESANHWLLTKTGETLMLQVKAVKTAL